MTNKEILEKVICEVKGYSYGCIIFPEVLEDKKYYPIIFSHEFAKKFWGDKLLSGCCREELKKDQFGIHCSNCNRNIHKDNVGAGQAWQLHLEIMVLHEQPLKYLEKFL